jgi:predicted glycoside hydrolase/deacetylase ChbG (UPF0249 family)
MVMRPGCDPEPLLATGAEVGLHLELEGVSAWGTRWAGPRDRDRATAALREQLERFERLFGCPAAYVDGHHHCHAARGLASALALAVREQHLPLRSVNARHRRLLRGVGVATPHRLVGRLRESQPALPGEIGAFLDGTAGLPRGVIEWMTHPGHRDPTTGSGYDAGREEDLALLVELAERGELRPVRATHAALAMSR